MSITTRLKRLSALWPYLLVLPLAWVQYMGAVAATKVAPDETGWIRASATVALLVMQGDFTPSSWRADSDNVYGYCNPQLGKLVFSLPLMFNLMSGTGALPPLPDTYDFSKSREENEKEKRLPPAYILEELRLVGAFFGVVLCGVCMRIVQVLCGSGGAFLAGGLLVFHPVMISTSGAVMTDGIYQMFTLLAVLCAMRLYATEERREVRRWSVRTAVAAGLAGAVKYAAPVILFPYFFLLLMSARYAGRLAARQVLWLSSGFFAVFLLVTYVLNPFLWPNVSKYDGEALGREWRLLRDGEFTLPVRAMPPDWMQGLHLKFGDEIVVEDGNNCFRGLNETSRERLVDHLLVTQLISFHPSNQYHPSNIVPVLYEISRPVQLPLMYFRWHVFKDQLFSSGHWKLPNTGTFLERVVFRGAVLPLETVWALLGLCVVGWRMRHGPTPQRYANFAFLLFVPIAFVLVFATRLADIERYLLLLFVLRTMLAAIALQAILAFGVARLRRVF